MYINISFNSSAFKHNMTDEEADALDELLMKTTPKLTNIPGIFARQQALLGNLDEVNANYILTKAEAYHKTPAKDMRPKH